MFLLIKHKHILSEFSPNFPLLIVKESIHLPSKYLPRLHETQQFHKEGKDRSGFH